MSFYSKLKWLTLSSLGIMAFFAVDLSLSAPKKVTRIAIIQIVEHLALNQTRQGIMDTLKDHAIQIDYQSAQGNSALATQIAQQFVGSSPAVLVGIGTTASQALISADQYRKIPIVFSSVTDPVGSKIVQNLKHPDGIVTGVSNFIDPALQFDFMKKLMPTLTRVGIIYNAGEANSVALVEQMKKIAKEKNLILRLATANTSVDVVEATHKLIPEVQAIFINNDNTALSAFDSIIKISTKDKIPVFCSDIDMIDRGAFAALGPNQYAIGRQTGQLILAILKGDKPSALPILFPDKTVMRFNLEQAKKLGITIPDTLLQSQQTETNQS